MKHCDKCGVETARKANGACKPCAARWQREWCAKNRDKKAAMDAAYAAKNAEKLKAYKAAYYLENRERLRFLQKQWRADNAVAIRRKVREWRLANPQKAKATAAAWASANKVRVNRYKRTWSAANPEVHATKEANRRAMKRASAGKVCAADIKTLMNMQKRKCPLCGSSLDFGYHIDHVMPLALGGGNGPDNIQLLCPPCNLSKSAKHPVDFMQQRGFLL